MKTIFMFGEKNRDIKNESFYAGVTSTYDPDIPHNNNIQTTTSSGKSLFDKRISLLKTCLKFIS